MHAAATHAASVEAASASTETSATTSAAAGIGIVGDQAGGEHNECCKSSENAAKHDNDLFCLPRGRLLRSTRGRLM
jgi:hypothetical protein